MMHYSKKVVIGLAVIGGLLLLQHTSGVAQVRASGADVSSVQVSVSDMKKEINALKAEVAALKAQLSGHEANSQKLWSQVNQDNKRIAELKAAYLKHSHTQTVPKFKGYARSKSKEGFFASDLGDFKELKDAFVVETAPPSQPTQ